MEREARIQCVRIMTKDPLLIQNWREFADGLNISEVTLFQLNDQFKRGLINLYELYLDILNHWVAQNGRSATIQELLSVLGNQGFMFVKEQIMDEFNLIRLPQNDRSEIPSSETLQTAPIEIVPLPVQSIIENSRRPDPDNSSLLSAIQNQTNPATIGPNGSVETLENHSLLDTVPNSHRPFAPQPEIHHSGSSGLEDYDDLKAAPDMILPQHPVPQIIKSETRPEEQNNLLLPITNGSQAEANSPDDGWTNQLKMVECLGAGSFGIVMRAHYQNSSIPTAIKFVTSEAMSGNDSIAEEDTRLRECDNMRNKSHPNVVTVKRYTTKRFTEEDINICFQTDTLKYTDEANNLIDTITGRARRAAKQVKDGKIELICIEMELCGPTLRSWLTKDDKEGTLRDMTTSKTREFVGKTDVEDMVFWKAEIAQGTISGLKYLHSKNIIHRDLKPENIYFSRNGQDAKKYDLPIKIGDLGLSRAVPGYASVSMTKGIGTLLYRAPEVKNGRYSARADWYGVGLLLFELFYSIPHRDLQETFEALKYAPNTVLDGSFDEFIPNFKQTIIKLTRPKTSERFSSPDEIVFNLEVPGSLC